MLSVTIKVSTPSVVILSVICSYAVAPGLFIGPWSSRDARCLTIRLISKLLKINHKSAIKLGAITFVQMTHSSAIVLKISIIVLSVV